MEDTEIIKLYWNRDQQAIVESKEKYSTFCYYIANNVLRSHEDSEECVNDTWLKAWNAIPPEWPKVLACFLGAITRNVSLDRYRSRNAKKRGNGEIEYIFREMTDCIVPSNVEAHLNTLVLGEAINRFLKEIPKDQRVVFVRRYWYMDSTKEIAKRFAMSESKVKTSLFRTRKKLRLHLLQEGIAI